MADEIGVPRRRHYVAGYRAARAFATGAALSVGESLYRAGILQDPQAGPEMSPPRPSGGAKRRYSEEAMYGPRKSLATRDYVKRCMRSSIEVKSLPVQNFVGNAGVPTTSGRVDPIQTFNIVDGSGDDNRDGNFVKLKKLDMRMFCSLAADNLATALVRVVVVKDKQTNGATPAITEILTTGTGGVLAGYNADNVVGYGGKRFTVLRDFVKYLNPANVVDATNTLPETKAWTFSIYEKSLGEVHFDASAGAITDIVSGEIFVATISDNATALVNGSHQLLFYDA